MRSSANPISETEVKEKERKKRTNPKALRRPNPQL